MNNVSSLKTHQVTQKTSMPFAVLVELARRYYGDLNPSIGAASCLVTLHAELTTAHANALARAQDDAAEGTLRRGRLSHRVELIANFIANNLKVNE